MGRITNYQHEIAGLQKILQERNEHIARQNSMISRAEVEIADLKKKLAAALQPEAVAA